MPEKRGKTQPPQAPEVERRLRLNRLQRLGMPLIALFPLLALLGVFGISSGHRTSSGESISLAVDFPSRTRLRSGAAMVIEVSNRGGVTIEGVTVGVERDYVERFTNVSFNPAVAAVSERYFEVELGALAPGAVSVVAVELEPSDYWRHEGKVRVTAGGDETSVVVETFVFP